MLRAKGVGLGAGGCLQVVLITDAHGLGEHAMQGKVDPGELYVPHD
jgi:hypothetical protein